MYKILSLKPTWSGGAKTTSPFGEGGGNQTQKQNHKKTTTQQKTPPQ